MRPPRGGGKKLGQRAYLSCYRETASSSALFFCQGRNHPEDFRPKSPKETSASARRCYWSAIDKENIKPPPGKRGRRNRYSPISNLGHA